MPSARRLADTHPVASATHRLPCKMFPYVIRPRKRSGVVYMWSGPGTVWNDMESDLERGLECNIPLQHSTASVAHIQQIRKFKAASNSWTASQQQLSASLSSYSTAAPQRETTISSTGANLPQVEREGRSQAIYSQIASQQQRSTSIKQVATASVEQTCQYNHKASA